MLARPRAAPIWFSSNLQTYLERAISAVQDLAAFRRFLGLVASRHGQILNKSDLAAPLGMSVPGIGRWLDILEATGQILVVPPYFENLGKRRPRSTWRIRALPVICSGSTPKRSWRGRPFSGRYSREFVSRIAS